MSLALVDRQASRKRDIPARFHYPFVWEMLMGGIMAVPKSIEDHLDGRVQFGEYTILGEGEKLGKHRTVRCKCSCGKVNEIKLTVMKHRPRFMCISCSNENNITRRKNYHGMTDTPEYNTWRGMKRRCYEQSNDWYCEYGARGIEVCTRWLESFEAFYEDMGKRPSKNHSIDRIDNDGNYAPDNCRWATQTEQLANRRITRKIEYRGKEFVLTDFARRFNISPNVLYLRVHKLGWDIEKAISEPLQKQSARHG